MRSDRGFGGLRFNTISTHKSEETNETHLYSTSRLQWEPWALGAAQREVSSVSYSFTSALCPSDSACFRNINLLYFTPKLCIMCALCTQLERRLSPYQVLLRFMTRKFRASSKLSCFLREVGVSRVTGLYWNNNTGPRMSFLFYCRKNNVYNLSRSMFIIWYVLGLILGQLFISWL